MIIPDCVWILSAKHREFQLLNLRLYLGSRSGTAIGVVKMTAALSPTIKAMEFFALNVSG